MWRYLDVLLVFLRLGLTSFGGPVAHLGYFRTLCVKRKAWLTDEAFSEIVALCQFLPGPASSQTGFAIGLLRAGFWGGIAAWLGFTLPSGLIMTLLALCHISANVYFAPALHGLQLVAVAIVAQAILGMARNLCPDATRATIAICSAALALFYHGPIVQISVMACCAVAGLVFYQPQAGMNAALPAGAEHMQPVGNSFFWLLGFAFLLLLCLPPAPGFYHLQGLAAFYRSGALVFGGGHVVLPLLQQAVVSPGWVSSRDFLAGYGAAQAMPGPLFSFAAYLGALMPSPLGGAPGAVLALIAVFLPGLLLVLGCLPYWQRLRLSPIAAGSLQGVNAGVVGLLAAAFYDPVCVHSVHRLADLLIAVMGYILLAMGRLPVIAVVLIVALLPYLIAR